MRERFPDRDRRLKEFAEEAQNGCHPSSELQRDFIKFTGQIAARKGLRMNVAFDRLDDLVGTVVLKVFETIKTGRYKVTDAPIAGYISLLTRNQVINDSARKRAAENWLDRKKKEALKRASEKNFRPVEEEVILREVLNEVVGKIEELPRQQQEALLLTARGLSTEEVCRSLDITPRALVGKLYRARKVLKLAL